MVTVEGNWVEFNFYRPSARQVHLVGDFNHWHEATLPMARTAEGYWRARLRLPEGEYHFRYRADGHWFTDYAGFGVEQGPFGLDSVIRVHAHSVEKRLEQPKAEPSKHVDEIVTFNPNQVYAA